MHIQILSNISPFQMTINNNEGSAAVLAFNQKIELHMLCLALNLNTATCYSSCNGRPLKMLV